MINGDDFLDLDGNIPDENIHIAIEYPIPSCGYISFAQDVSCEQEYIIFEALAGVPTHPSPLFPPKGFPKNASRQTMSRYYQPVITSESAEIWTGYDYILLKDYQKTYSHRELIQPECLPVSNHGWMVRPDFHTSSHLTVSEIEDALEKARIAPGPLLNTVLLALRALTTSFGERCRIVFWFETFEDVTPAMVDRLYE
ncbi:MAG: hypothetical protein QM496_18330 [Verrucomicrobiota bacterium]